MLVVNVSIIFSLKVSQHQWVDNKISFNQSDAKLKVKLKVKFEMIVCKIKLSFLQYSQSQTENSRKSSLLFALDLQNGDFVANISERPVSYGELVTCICDRTSHQKCWPNLTSENY